MRPTGGVRAALLIDSSTIDPPTAREVDAAVATAALHHDAKPCSGCSAAHPSLIDAPVSGGITGASKATLTFMVSDPAAANDDAKSLHSPAQDLRVPGWFVLVAISACKATMNARVALNKSWSVLSNNFVSTKWC